MNLLQGSGARAREPSPAASARPPPAASPSPVLEDETSTINVVVCRTTAEKTNSTAATCSVRYCSRSPTTWSWSRPRPCPRCN
ncbi:MAG: hypothetical protein MZW92_06935 [Comamonadaceae bacterium]|nr:hypothetical protein [Comamonadaceae bacterium]